MHVTQLRLLSKEQMIAFCYFLSGALFFVCIYYRNECVLNVLLLCRPAYNRRALGLKQDDRFVNCM